MAAEKKPLAIAIKEQYKDERVGYNNSAAPLGQRDDLHLLAEQALLSNNPNLIRYFEKMPTIQEIIDFKGQLFIEKTAK